MERRAEKRQQIFEYDTGGSPGIGLFICRQIIEVTGTTIQETGTEGKGARFTIHVPPADIALREPVKMHLCSRYRM